jgi:hypothetical protein
MTAPKSLAHQMLELSKKKNINQITLAFENRAQREFDTLMVSIREAAHLGFLEVWHTSSLPLPALARLEKKLIAEDFQVSEPHPGRLFVNWARPTQEKEA